MVDSDKKETKMKCSISGCPGDYEERFVIHTVKYHGKIIVIENVPAEVCSTCGDILFKPDTVKKIENLLASTGKPLDMVPLYEFA
jgi:HTH-type transcriptional regulator / antitoxin MqsA